MTITLSTGTRNRAALTLTVTVLGLTRATAANATLSARRAAADVAVLRAQLAESNQRVEAPERAGQWLPASSCGADNSTQTQRPIERDGFPAAKWLLIGETASTARTLD